MYFTECARLAEQHPDLASVFEQVDSRLRAMGTAVVIRLGDMASFLSLDPNQVISVLNMLAEVGVLRRVEMIECAHCEMAAPRTDYLHGLKEDDEYRCTSCDQPLTDETVEIITTYRPGRKWEAVSNINDSSDDVDLRKTSSSSTSNLLPDEQSWYAYGRLAEIFEVDRDALRKRLDRFRARNWNGWKTDNEHGPRESKYLYQLREFKAILDELQASSQRPAK